jgi:hypothetical protein
MLIRRKSGPEEGLLAHCAEESVIGKSHGRQCQTVNSPVQPTIRKTPRQCLLELGDGHDQTDAYRTHHVPVLLARSGQRCGAKLPDAKTAGSAIHERGCCKRRTEQRQCYKPHYCAS